MSVTVEIVKVIFTIVTIIGIVAATVWTYPTANDCSGQDLHMFPVHSNMSASGPRWKIGAEGHFVSPVGIKCGSR